MGEGEGDEREKKRIVRVVERGVSAHVALCAKHSHSCRVPVKVCCIIEENPRKI